MDAVKYKSRFPGWEAAFLMMENADNKFVFIS